MAGCSGCTVGQQIPALDRFPGLKATRRIQAGYRPVAHNAPLCHSVSPLNLLRHSHFQKKIQSEARKQSRWGGRTVSTLALDREHVSLPPEAEVSKRHPESAENRSTERQGAGNRAGLHLKGGQCRVGCFTNVLEGHDGVRVDLGSDDGFIDSQGNALPDTASARQESSNQASTSESNGLSALEGNTYANAGGVKEANHSSRSSKLVMPVKGKAKNDRRGTKGGSVNEPRSGANVPRRSARRRHAGLELQPMKDEALRRAVEDAFPMPDRDIGPPEFRTSTTPQDPLNSAVSANPVPSVDPSFLLDALAQPPSKLREIASDGGHSPVAQPPLIAKTSHQAEAFEGAITTADANTAQGADTTEGAKTPLGVKTPSKADAVERARAALLDPAVIANWDKIVVSDWDPLPVSLVPFRGGFADRRGVVRSAQNPPKPHPLTSLSTLYKDVVALFDPAGVDSLLDRRRDERLISRGELLELIKRLGEAGGSVKKPLAVFRWMQRQEDSALRPTEASYSVMVRLLGKLHAADAAVGLIREMEASGLSRNVQTYNALLGGLAKRGKYDECWHLFQQMKSEGPVPEVWTYNNLITAAAWCLGGREALKQGLSLLEEMQKGGLKPNVFTYNALMQTGVKARELAEVKRLFGEMRERGCQPDLVSFNTIIKACLDQRDWQGVSDFFAAMPAAECAPDATTYDCIILAHTQQQRFDEALSMLDEMREAGCRPDLRTYNSLLHACAEAGEGDRARGLLRSMLRLEMKPTIFHWCSLMNAFAKVGRCDDAASVFRDMQSAKVVPTIYAYNILLDAYCRAGRFSTAEGLLRIMQKSPCKPNIVSYNTLIGAYARSKDLEQVKLVFRAMLKGGCSPNNQTQRLVSKVFLDARREREATSLFWEAKQVGKRRRRMQAASLEVLDSASGTAILTAR